MSANMTTDQLYNALRDHYSAPAYGFLTEVADATGGRHSRWCDGLAMSLWPSRGLDLIGIEVKVSRSDWVKELKNPAKAEAICKFCDRWYLAVSDKAIVKPGELPTTWGLLVPKGESLVEDVPAPKLTPEPPTRHFMAAIFRRAAEQSVDERKIAAARQAGRDEGIKTADERIKRNAESFSKTQDQLILKVQEFEKASGIQIAGGWHNGKKLGEAVRRLLMGDLLTPVERAERIKSALTEALKNVEEALRDELLVSSEERTEA